MVLAVKIAGFCPLLDAIVGLEGAKASTARAVICIHDEEIEIMSVDTVQPTLGVPVVHPNQDANRQSGRDPQRNGKPGQSDQEQPDQANPVLNALGELTGRTINITA